MKRCIWCGKLIAQGEDHLSISATLGLHHECKVDVDAEHHAMVEADRTARKMEARYE